MHFSATLVEIARQHPLHNLYVKAVKRAAAIEFAKVFLSTRKKGLPPEPPYAPAPSQPPNQQGNLSQGEPKERIAYNVSVRFKALQSKFSGALWKS